MAAEWKSAPIGDFFDLISGYAFKSSDFLEEGVPVIKIKNVKASRMLYDDLSYVDPSFLIKRADKIIQRGDILITMSGNRFDGSSDTWVGKVAQFNEEGKFLLNQRVGILRPKPGTKLDQRFFSYFLSADSYQKEFIAIATSSGGQANLSPLQILNARMQVPPLLEQKTIAYVLGTLDDKIELNRKMNETLEGIARAIFKSWFVDFDPVRAKMEGKQPVGMDAETAGQFPCRFEQIDQEEIPKSWKLGRLGEIAENPRRGVDPSRIEEDTPYIGLEHMPRKSIVLGEWGKAQDLASGKFRFQQGEILFGKLRPYFHKVGIAPINGVCSTDILVIVPKGDSWYGPILGIVSSDEFVNYTNYTSTGTKMPRTSWNEMAKYPVVIPPETIANRFGKLIHPLLDQIRTNIFQSRTLSLLRDALLPKLLSGEIRIKEAEALIEAKL